MLKWAIVGICIAIVWTAYIFASAPDSYVIAVATAAPQISLRQQLLRAVMTITCPAILSGMIFYWMIPLNGVIYAIVGFAVALVQSRAKP
jgi:hypothetical protein